MVEDAPTGVKSEEKSIDRQVEIPPAACPHCQGAFFRQTDWTARRRKYLTTRNNDSHPRRKPREGRRSAGHPRAGGIPSSFFVLKPPEGATDAAC